MPGANSEEEAWDSAGIRGAASATATTRRGASAASSSSRNAWKAGGAPPPPMSGMRGALVDPGPKPKKKMKALHWTKLPDTRAKNTFWDASKVSRILSLFAFSCRRAN